MVTAGCTSADRVARVNEPPFPARPSAVSPVPVRPLPGHPADVQHRPAAGDGDVSDRGTGPAAARRALVLQSASILVLCPVAGIGAALSLQSLHEAAAPIFGPLAFGFPLLVDMLILGATLAFLAGATVGRPLPGWRWTAHGGVSGTLLLNAMAADGPATIPWHVTPAVVWSVLVEMAARQVTGHTTLSAAVSEPIPARIWLSSPWTRSGPGCSWPAPENAATAGPEPTSPSMPPPRRFSPQLCPDAASAAHGV